MRADRLGEGSRTRLLDALRRAPAKITELAALLGISGNAVRTHIAALERDGWIRRARVDRQTGGKPAIVYEIAPQAEERFPKGYGVVLAELLTTLRESDGVAAVTRLLRRVGVRLAQAAGQRPTAVDERVAAAAGLLRSLGGQVDVQDVKGGWRLQAHGCPLSAVIGTHPEACALAEALVAEVTGRRVTEMCDRGERPRCAFHIARGSMRPATA